MLGVIFEHNSEPVSRLEELEAAKDYSMITSTQQTGRLLPKKDVRKIYQLHFSDLRRLVFFVDLSESNNTGEKLTFFRGNCHTNTLLTL